MIDYAESLKIIRKHAKEISEEPCALETAVGRIAYKTIVSPEVVPPFANSAMDGFALRSSELDVSEFALLGSIAAGDAPRTTESEQGAWEIMTGAPLPLGFDTVIKVEDTKLINGRIQLSRTPTKGENVRPAGEDFQEGSPALERGTRIEPQHLLVLATLGISEISVYRRPNVSIISTGSELESFKSKKLTPGCIRNSTAPYLVAELTALGAKVEYHGVVGDQPSEFFPVFRRVLESKPDLLITTGAVSMGKYDFVTTAMKDLGVGIYFHKVAIRPGKPLLFGQLDQTTVFGLPGNPVSSAVGVRFFVEPYLRAAQSLEAETPIPLPLTKTVKKPKGLRCFFKATVTATPKELVVESLPGQSSALVSPLLKANAWVELPAEETEIPAGTMVATHPLHSWKGFS